MTERHNEIVAERFEAFEYVNILNKLKTEVLRRKY